MLRLQDGPLRVERLAPVHERLVLVLQRGAGLDDLRAVDLDVGRGGREHHLVGEEAHALRVVAHRVRVAQVDDRVDGGLVLEVRRHVHAQQGHHPHHDGEGERVHVERVVLHLPPLGEVELDRPAPAGGAVDVRQRVVVLVDLPALAPRPRLFQQGPGHVAVGERDQGGLGHHQEDGEELQALEGDPAEQPPEEEEARGRDGDHLHDEQGEEEHAECVHRVHRHVGEESEGDTHILRQHAGPVLDDEHPGGGGVRLPARVHVGGHLARVGHIRVGDLPQPAIHRDERCFPLAQVELLAGDARLLVEIPQVPAERPRVEEERVLDVLEPRRKLVEPRDLPGRDRVRVRAGAVGRSRREEPGGDRHLHANDARPAGVLHPPHLRLAPVGEDADHGEARHVHYEEQEQDLGNDPPHLHHPTPGLLRFEDLHDLLQPLGHVEVGRVPVRVGRLGGHLALGLVVLVGRGVYGDQGTRHVVVEVGKGPRGPAAPARGAAEDEGFRLPAGVFVVVVVVAEADPPRAGLPILRLRRLGRCPVLALILHHGQRVRLLVLGRRVAPGLGGVEHIPLSSRDGEDADVVL
mmetsp:Transcript_42097/g.134489  ORF Transcript_42097/g.134489 Transcript_42097/m.134489 type:complete len:578 (-) Transcript_42097:652-2385(-)